ncbi:MAG: hypothetical protein ACYC5M_16835 [Anaerolineae bacterium]
MAVAVCPGCDEDVRMPGRPKMGQHTTCPSCGSLLEVVSANPLELDWAFEDEEDLEEEDLNDEDEEEDE